MSTPQNKTDKKLDYLKREEVRTMEKDIAGLRERESETAREKISQIKTAEEVGKEAERSEQSRKAAEEREKIEMEDKKREEELKISEAERKERQKLMEEEALKQEELDREKLRAQLKETQLKEEERRKKFLEDISAKAGEPAPEEAEEKPVPPPIPPVPPAPQIITPSPPEPTPTPPPPVIAKPPAPVAPTPKPSIKKPFKFAFPSLRIPKPKIPSIQLPKVGLPKIEGYFPQKPSILEKIWIRIIVSLFIVAILATVVTFWYWYLVVREKPPGTEVIEEPVKQEATAPLPLIPTENTETIEITSPTELPNLLSQTLGKNFGENKFTRLLVKNTAENKFLGLKEFFEAFQIKTPENFYSNVDNDFTLFIFSSSIKNQLGLIAKTQNPAVLRSILESWEKTLEKDTDNLFLSLGKTGSEESLFQKSTYKDVVVHYLSFPGENFGICWAITDNYFIFTSSGESIIRTIDKVKE